MGNGRNKRNNGKRNKRNWTKCPQCGAKVRPDNLASHKIRVHGKFYQKPKGQASIAGIAITCLVVLLLLLVPNPLFSPNDDGTDSNVRNTVNDDINKQDQTSTSNSQRTVLIETFTSVDCYWCNAEEEPALKRIVQDYTRDEVVIVAYHGFYGNDPYQTPEGNARANYYGGVSGTPSVWFDGVINKVGGTGQGVDAMYNVYANHIDQRAEVATSVSMDVSGSISGSQVQVTVSITEGNLDPQNTKIRFALMEDDIMHDDKAYHWVVRDYSEKPISSGSFPQDISESFDVKGDWNADSLRVVVWVQDDVSKEVLQASYLGFNT
jgi:hypothetical protein